MRLSACLIAKNERENVAPCLASFGDHVDEIVFVDTGSRDGTVAEVRRVCRARGWTDKLLLGQFRWRDDFAAARNRAHSLATGDVHIWIDLDDRLEGADHLAELAEQFRDPAVDAIAARYVVLVPEDHRYAVGDWRELMWRRAVRWVGRTWEDPEIAGEIRLTELVRKWHGRTTSHGDRDILIARRWCREDSRSSRPRLTLALALGEQGRYGDEMLRVVDELLAMRLRSAQRAEALAWRAVIMFDRDRLAEAARDAIEAVEFVSNYSASWTILAACALRRENFQLAEACARQALAAPTTTLDMLKAGVMLACAQAGLGQLDEACGTAETTLRHAHRSFEGYELLTERLAEWEARGRATRQRATHRRPSRP